MKMETAAKLGGFVGTSLGNIVRGFLLGTGALAAVWAFGSMAGL